MVWVICVGYAFHSQIVVSLAQIYYVLVHFGFYSTFFSVIIILIIIIVIIIVIIVIIIMIIIYNNDNYNGNHHHPCGIEIPGWHPLPDANPVFQYHRINNNNNSNNNNNKRQIIYT